LPHSTRKQGHSNSSSLISKVEKHKKPYNDLLNNQKEYNKIVDFLNNDYVLYLRTCSKENHKQDFPGLMQKLKDNSKTYSEYFFSRNDTTKDFKLATTELVKSLNKNRFKIKKLRENLERLQNTNDEFLLSNKKILKTCNSKEKEKEKNNWKFKFNSKLSSNISLNNKSNLKVIHSSNNLNYIKSSGGLNKSNNMNTNSTNNLSIKKEQGMFD